MKVISPVVGLTERVPSGVVDTIETEPGTRAAPAVTGLSLFNVGKVTGVPIKVLAISVFAIGGLAGALGSVTVIVKVSVGQFEVKPGGHNGTSYTYTPGVCAVNS